MIYRLTLADWRTIAHYLGTLVIMTSIAMVIPFAVALACGEFKPAMDFLLSIGISLTFGGLLVLCKTEKGELDWRQALIVTGLSWVVLSFIGSIPLVFSGHYANFIDALFEATSAFTTTGLSVCIDIDHMSNSVMLWRFIMHIAGGIGVLVIALALGIFGTGAATASLYSAEGRSGHVLPDVKQTAQFIGKVSVAVCIVGTFVCGLILFIYGLPVGSSALNGFFLTVAAFETGGLTSHSLGLMYFHSWPLEMFTLVLMMFGCINFLLYGDLWRGVTKKFFKDIEIRTIGIWIVGLVTLMSIALMTTGFFNDTPSMLRRGIFEVLSAGFNTGYSTMFSGQLLYAMGSGAVLIVVLGMTMGGSASSTAGGFKAMRVGLIFRSFVQTVRTAISPEHVRPRTFFYHQGRQLLTSELVSSAMTIVLLFIFAAGVGTVVGIACGYDAMPALFEAVSAATNTGLSSGVTAVGMPKVLEIVYIVMMWLGRLEFIAFFAVIVQILLMFFPRAKRGKDKGAVK